MLTYRFSLFGQTLTTTEDFSHSLPFSPLENSLNLSSQSLSGPAHSVEIELIVKHQVKAPEDEEFQQVFPAVAITDKKPASLFIYTASDRLRIVYLDFAVYDIIGHRIICYPSAQTSDKQLHLNFLGPVISMWLEQNGYLVLHASAILINGTVTVFLADSQQGKSTIASQFIKMGYPLVSDDLLAINYNQLENRYFSYPSYPVIKLWPEQFSRIFDDKDPAQYLDEGLKKCRVRVDELNQRLFCSGASPLALIYCLQRYENSKRLLIEPVSQMDAVTRLIRYSFAAPILIATGWQPQRLQVFSSMVSKIPVRQLSCPSDTRRLDSVCKRILSDIASVG